jgi:hypothetical protein
MKRFVCLERKSAWPVKLKPYLDDSAVLLPSVSENDTKELGLPIAPSCLLWVAKHLSTT